MALVGVGVGGGVAVLVVESMVSTVVVVVVGVLLAGHLFVVGIVFLITIAAISRIIARTMSRAMRVVAVSV